MSDAQISASSIIRHPPPTWRAVFWASVRTLGSSTAIITLYYVVPFDRPMDLGTLALVVVANVVFVAVLVYQVLAIVRSSTPGLRAIEALAVSIPLLLVCFASVYFLIARTNAAAFTEPLTRTDALYFTVTVFATVGFGDISATTESARLVVTAQMLIDLLILGIGLRVIVGAVRLAKERRPPSAGSAE